MRRPSPIIGIFITVLLDLLNFGMFIPDLQLRIRAQAATMLDVPQRLAETDSSVAWYLGFVTAAFSLAQLVSSPILGGLSDRVGRRKILIFTCALAVLGNGLYAFADSYWLAFTARVLSGIAAANLGVAFAYIADVTKPEERAAALGKLGAAFGIGFTLGPPLGALLLSLGGGDQLLLGLVGTAFALINLLWVQFLLPESLPAEEGEAAARDPFLLQLRIALTTPGLSLLLGIFFLVNFGFANLQTTFFLLLEDSRSIFRLGKSAQSTGGIILGLVGIFTALMQFFVVPFAVKRLGEVGMLRIGLLLLVPGLGLVPFSPLWAPVITVVGLQAIANGLTSPSLSSLISQSAPARIQGGIFGINQALGAAARALSPAVALPLFTLSPVYPYLVAGSAVAIAALGANFLLPDPRRTVAAAPN